MKESIFINIVVNTEVFLNERNTIVVIATEERI